MSTAATLGLSDLELRVYSELLRGGAATGYRVAKSLGRPGANVYQALRSLEQKGAVMLADPADKAYRAIAPEEFVSSLEREHRTRLADARSALVSLERAAEKDTVSQLASASQALERAIGMIERATEIILFDLFPGPFAELLPHLQAARSRGVKVAGVIYEAAPNGETPWALTVPKPLQLGDRWPGQGLILVRDAQECLISLLTPDMHGLLHGVWSDSPYLCCVQHSGLGTEIRLQLLLQSQADPMPEISLMASSPPGLRALGKRRGNGGPDPEFPTHDGGPQRQSDP